MADTGMAALVLNRPGDFEYCRRSRPERLPGQALVKIEAVAICGSDMHAIAGRMPLFSFPRIIGHEISATVVEVEANLRGIAAGDRVCVMPCIACGACIACRKGKTNCCTSLRLYGVQEDGGLQEYLALPVESLAKVPESARPEETALVEPLTIGAHAVRRVGVDAGDIVLVLGAGPIGVCCALLAAADKATPVLADVNPRRAAFVRERFGFDVINPLAEDFQQQVGERTGGELFHAVFDTTANKQSMDHAYSLVGHGGKVVFVGVHPGTVEMPGAAFHMKEPTLAVTRNSMPEDFARVLTLWDSGVLRPDALLTHTAAFDNAAAEMVAWSRGEGEVFKGVVLL